MAIPHASSGEPINIQPFATHLPSAKTVALFKSEDLEVVRLVLLAGKSLPLHKVPGEITIQCIEGQLDVMVDGARRRLGAGQLLFLARSQVHGVAAIEDSSALVTVALRK